MSKLLRCSAAAAVAWAVLAGSSALAEDVAASVAIKDHAFTPMEIKVPAGKTIVLTVDNQDATPEEFESPELKVEKVIPGGSTGKVRFGPLAKGSYLFIGEFNQKTARGVVTAE